LKYIKFSLQKIICAIICVLLTVLVLILNFNVVFIKKNLIKNINADYISMQKTKLNSDLQSVCYANGVKYELFNDLITDDIIIKNNKEYLNSVFDYIEGKVPNIIEFTNTANKFEISIKEILMEYYSLEFGKEEYTINENSINNFANLEKANFSHSVVPILGFGTFVNYLKKYSLAIKVLPYYLVLGILLFFLLLILFNKRKKVKSFINILYATSAAGLILSIFNSLALWTIVTKNTALNSSYLKIIALSYTKVSLIVGILLLLFSQILLIISFKRNKNN